MPIGARELVVYYSLRTLPLAVRGSCGTISTVFGQARRGKCLWQMSMMCDLIASWFAISAHSTTMVTASPQCAS